eukprot:2114037-Prymnesium_polylepis.1
MHNRYRQGESGQPCASPLEGLDIGVHGADHTDEVLKCVCATRLTWGRCRVSGHSPTSTRAGSRDIGRQRSSGRPGT